MADVRVSENTDNLTDRIGFPDMRQELIPEALPGRRAAYEPGDPVVYGLQEARTSVSLVTMRGTQLGEALASRMAAKSKQELAVVHAETEVEVVGAGSQTVGFLAFERPQSTDVAVVRLNFAADGDQQVTATLVL